MLCGIRRLLSFVGLFPNLAHSSGQWLSLLRFKALFCRCLGDVFSRKTEVIHASLLHESRSKLSLL